MLNIAFEVKYPQNNRPKIVGRNAPLQWKYTDMVSFKIFRIESNRPPSVIEYPCE